MMFSERASLVIVLLFLAIGGWFAFTTFAQKAPLDVPSAYRQTDPVTVHQTTVDGEVILSGTLFPVSDCTDVSSGIALMGSAEPRMTLVLTLREPVGCEANNFGSQEFRSTVRVAADTKTPTFDGVTVNGVIQPHVLVKE